MGKVKTPRDVKLVMAITFNDESVFKEAISCLKNEFGEIDLRSQVYDFHHTDYYEKEMGKPLRKQFISFKGLIQPDKLAGIKLRTNQIEAMFSSQGRRRVNIDPGYIEGSKLVLATTKNYDHRIYLGEGIYGDVQLRFREGAFRINEWTYPDYREKLALGFFAEVRREYLKQLSRYSPMTYKEAGVDIEAGNQAVERIKSLARRTHRPEVLAGIGGFGGLFQLSLKGLEQPVLVTSVDGVGSKLKIAFLMDKHDTVGEDLVNHCVNDIMVCGAEPLYFLDYIATGRLRPNVIEQIVKGIVRGCSEVGCSLLGGEMAEMPDFYRENEYDLVGTIVGMVDKSKIIDGSDIEKGDLLIGLPSNGLHTNGFSLARKVFFEIARLSCDSYIDELGCSLGEELLKVHKCYYQLIARLKEGGLSIKGLAHVTGGGIEGNTRRILPEGLSLEINWESWPLPPVFSLIKRMGNVPDSEMRKTFNMGIGLVIVIGKGHLEEALNQIKSLGEEAYMIGEVTSRC